METIRFSARHHTPLTRERVDRITDFLTEDYGDISGLQAVKVLAENSRWYRTAHLREIPASHYHRQKLLTDMTQAGLAQVEGEKVKLTAEGKAIANAFEKVHSCQDVRRIFSQLTTLSWLNLTNKQSPEAIYAPLGLVDETYEPMSGFPYEPSSDLPAYETHQLNANNIRRLVALAIEGKPSTVWTDLLVMGKACLPKFVHSSPDDQV